MKSEAQDRAGNKIAPGVGVCIVGLGNWGSSLKAALEKAGIPVSEVVVRKSRRSLGRVAVGPDAALYESEVIWLCVPDGAISETAAQIVRRRPDLRGQVVLHSSGALTIKALETARRAGAQVGAVAPVMSFPTRDIVQLDNVLFAVEATPRLCKRLAEIVRRLGGRPFRIASKEKVLYHAAATMASPLLVSALEAAVAVARHSGLSEPIAREVLGSLAAASVKNYFAKGAAEELQRTPGARGRNDDSTASSGARPSMRNSNRCIALWRTMRWRLYLYGIRERSRRLLVRGRTGKRRA